MIKPPVLCAADFEQLRANLASLRELANDALKLSENICDNRARFDINATEMVRYGVNTVFNGKHVLKRASAAP